MAKAASEAKKADKISKGIERDLDVLGFMKKINQK